MIGIRSHRTKSLWVHLLFLAALSSGLTAVSPAQTPAGAPAAASSAGSADELHADTQDPSTSSGQPQAASLERRFIKNVLSDQAVIWTAPFHLKRGDAWVLVPLGVGTAALIASDRHTSGLIGRTGSQVTISEDCSRMGAAYTTVGTAAAFYLIGRHTGNARARETGLIAAEALVDGAIVYGALKGITQRPRPNEADGHGRFFTGGNSFPSGHSIQAWALATVIAKEYGGDHPLVGAAMYGLAAMTSLSRYSGRRHFLSDVLIGSSVGFGIGRYVYKKRHDPALSAGVGGRKRFLASCAPSITPQYSPGARLYGATLTWER
jgi:membrane-associated phospholipid phosphatase